MPSPTVAPVRALAAATLLLMIMSAGCGGDNSQFGRRQSSTDAASADDVGQDTWSGQQDVDTDGLDAGPMDTSSGSDANTECQSVDEPDPDHKDTNCDGIDGDMATSVFVATYGDDANDGTMSHPLATIQAGIDMAAQDPTKSWVLVEANMFSESIELADGVNVVGGYGFGWTRDGAGRTLIRGQNPVIHATGLTSPTKLVDLEVEHDYQPDKGETVVAVYLENSNGVQLHHVKITGGAAGDGARGVTGAQGDTGATGGPGNKGTVHGGFACPHHSAPSVGSGAVSTCGGKKGGDGGAAGLGGDSGHDGSPGDGGTAGGAGAGSKQAGQKGHVGDAGDIGDAGTGADAGGQFDGMQWVGKTGETGGQGSGGNGGGGGGGGGGGTNLCDSYGGTGGGGGSGGCGGLGGEGGAPGGASVALLLVDSPDVVLDDCDIIGGQGGQGGAGGQGGPGGEGGPGGPGGSGEDDSGAGGVGGKGGRGGQGGPGGGGAGGPSFAIYTSADLSTDPTTTGTTLEVGFGGQGGSSPSAAGRGANGAAESLYVAQ